MPIMILSTFIMTLAIIFIIKIVLDHLHRQKRIAQGEPVESKDPILREDDDSPLYTLRYIKYGLICLGVGIPLLLDHTFHMLSREGTLGLMFVLAGAGFMIYYMIAKHAMREYQARKKDNPTE